MFSVWSRQSTLPLRRRFDRPKPRFFLRELSPMSRAAAELEPEKGARRGARSFSSRRVAYTSLGTWTVRISSDVLETGSVKEVRAYLLRNLGGPSAKSQVSRFVSSVQPHKANRAQGITGLYPLSGLEMVGGWASSH